MSSERQPKYANHNRNGHPRVLWMALLRDLNRGLTPEEQSREARLENERKAAREAEKAA